MLFHWSIVILIPGIILMLWSQARIQGTYRRYARISSNLGMTGAEVAHRILSQMGITDIRVEQVPGELSDHYDPGAKAVRLSPGIYSSSSLAAAAVAAHECGHVLQDKRGYKLMNLRSSLVPVANIGANFGPLLVLIGLLLGATGLYQLGILLFAGALAFHVVTLPVELDASHRALQLIDQLGILQGDENRGARAVLNAAAWTYVATAVYSALQLAQYLLLAGDD